MNPQLQQLTDLQAALKKLHNEKSAATTLFKIGHNATRGKYKNSIEELYARFKEKQENIQQQIDKLKKEIYKPAIGPVISTRDGDSNTVSKTEPKAIASTSEERSLVPVVVTNTLELVSDFQQPVKNISPNIAKITAPERPPKQTAELRNWQQDSANAMFEMIVGNQLDSRQEHYHACLLRAATGSGKTYMVGNVIARLLHIDFFKDWPAVYHTMVVTKANVVEQFKRDLKYQFGVDMDDGVLVTNYDQLRSSFGSNVLKRDIIIKQGNEIETFKWLPFLHPRLIIADEAHSLKNENSTQSKIFQALNEPPVCNKIFQIHMSATPFTRIADMKCFTCAVQALMF